MVEGHGLRKSDRVVRPITAAGGRTCARPGCPALARSTLTFAYEAKQAHLVGLLPEIDPASYDLCTTHADRTSPPFGWTICDERPPENGGAALDLADEDATVAVISAALKAVPPLAPPDQARPDEDVLALAEAAEVLAGAEVEIALQELTEVDAVVSSLSSSPTLPFDEDAPLSPDGHAQVW
ncbi:MAG TPA: DUF3499 family protein [Nitriliruptorales bacterium]